jgi:hypothetical protein
MSTPTKSKQPELGAAMMDVLRRPAEAGATASLAAIVGASSPSSSDAEDRPAPATPAKATRSEPIEPTASKSVAATRRAVTSSTVREKVEFEIETGRGTKSVTFRVPKELAGRLKLMAIQRQLSDAQGPRTINDIGLTALVEWIERNAA